jgi:hypothetical protein
MDRSEWLYDRYFQLGTQYYAAARSAVINQIDIVGGLLFHYAMEMLLKGYLCLTLTDEERKNTSHRLEDEVWPAFKNMVHDPDLDRYDSVVQRIDKFWDLRYPETVTMSVSLRIGFEPPPPGEIVTPKPTKHFELVVDEVDRLVAAIFKSAGRDPKAYKMHVGTGAKKYLDQWNKTNIWQ